MSGHVTGSTFKMCAMAKLTLRQARDQADMSRERLAFKAGVSPRTLYRIEHGATCPQLSTQRVIAAALEMPPKAIDWPTVAMKEAA